MYISVLNTVTIQLANDEYIKKISNGNIIKVINDIIAFDYL